MFRVFRFDTCDVQNSDFLDITKKNSKNNCSKPALSSFDNGLVMLSTFTTLGEEGVTNTRHVFCNCGNTNDQDTRVQGMKYKPDG